MKISDITKKNKIGNKYNLDVDGVFYVEIDKSLIVDLGLYKSMEVDKSFLDRIILTENYQKCLAKAFIFLSIRMFSEEELKRKLLNKFTEPIVLEVISRLKELKYVNDFVFASNWINSRLKDHGQYLLKQELRQKGVEDDLIESLLKSILEEDEIKRAKIFIEKKHLDGLAKEQKNKKAQDLLNRRGFSFSVINKALNEE